MGLWDKVKGIMVLPSEIDDDAQAQESVATTPTKTYSTEEQEPAPRKIESTPRVFQGGKAKTVQYPSNPAVQVVLVKLDRFEDVKSIADHINDKKMVVLNLEASERSVSRRIIDFLSGAAYANHGNFQRVATNTFIIVPQDGNVMGEMLFGDYDESKFTF